MRWIAVFAALMLSACGPDYLGAGAASGYASQPQPAAVVQTQTVKMPTATATPTIGTPGKPVPVVQAPPTMANCVLIGNTYNCRTF